jgi:hypothetical protein
LTCLCRDGEGPQITGDDLVAQAVALAVNTAVAPPQSSSRFDQIRSAFACALHMHQPTIPAGRNGELISHLQYMFEHPGEGDNHNAAAFADCYQRMAVLIPQLIQEGCDPRIMLDYSGNLLWGFQQMGRQDILDALRSLTCDPQLLSHVEWLGTFWSHAVAPSTPIPDLKLQLMAWRHHFSSLFGREALQRVQGFSLPEMHLPNHPDTLYELVKSLRECGYHWLLVQEDSVETLDGESLPAEQKWIPNQLVARNSRGDSQTILALIKTQGSDTKLVGQMQPYYEALGLDRQTIAGQEVPALVTQIADGENGGVMMNEFPAAFRQAHQRVAAAGHRAETVAMNGSEYLNLLAARGLRDEDYPKIQAIHQHTLWSAVGSDSNPERVEDAIAHLKAADPELSMTGASWTNNLSWVEGYNNVLEPMQELSVRFHQTFDSLVASDPAVTRDKSYQEALLALLLLETSCFRYWGQGRWTDYAREIHRRGTASLDACAANP